MIAAASPLKTIRKNKKTSNERRRKEMKEKIVGICICMLMMFTAFSAVATTNKQGKSPGDQNAGHRGGFLTQLPVDPGYTTNDWWAFFSGWYNNRYYQDYQMYTDVAGPIQGIHWWGLSLEDNVTFIPGDPAGMTFTIIFYKDNNTKPGEIAFTYSDIKPSITATGVKYPDVDLFGELYFFTCDLPSSCNLSTGWISIISTDSDNNCTFGWMESSTGPGHAYCTVDGEFDSAPQYGFSLVFTDGSKTSLEIVNMKGGFGVSLGIKNNGDATVDAYPVDFLVIGGMRKKIEVIAGDTISGLVPGATAPMQTGMFFGLGKIMIFVVGDGIITYKLGKQLFMYSIVQNK
jgi:hypothetical protein